MRVTSSFIPESRVDAADRLGMWIFLGSESLLFAGLMLAYALTRRHYLQGFAMGSRETSFILGTINTGVLLTSSLLAALADLRSGAERRPASRICALFTASERVFVRRLRRRA